MINIVLQGACGRMGRVLVSLIAGREDCVVSAGIDRLQDETLGFPVFASIQQLVQSNLPVDVVIDFSNPEGTKELLECASAATLPCVICTTGLPEEVRELLLAAATTSPLFFSANMSLGINLLVQLAKRAQAALPGFDIEIVEKHHHNKLDAPSGTALLLADAMNQQAGGRYEYMYDRQPLRQKRGENEIGIHAVRGGSIVGEHDVIFAGIDEVITLSHTAYSRDVFANGAIAAALYLAGKSAGLYNMQDLMEEM